MIHKTTLLLLVGSVCLLVLVQTSAAADSSGNKKPAPSAVTSPSDTTGEDQRKPAKGSRGGMAGRYDFRQEVVKIFDEFNIDADTRDKILTRIRELMEKLRGQMRFRKGKSRKNKGGSSGGDKTDKKEPRN